MSALTAHYTSFAEYMSACNGDSSKRVAHYAEQERQAAEEVQQAKDAALWRRFAAQCPSISGRLISKWALEDEQ